MGQSVNRLSSRGIAALKTPGRHADGAGLYLQVDVPPASRADEAGAKRWVLVFHWKGKRREMGLGPLSVLDLKEAREAAVAARKLVAKGIDPIEARKNAKADVGEVTFGEVADEVFASATAGFTNAKHVSQWKTSLEVYAEPIRAKAVRAIDTEDILVVLKPIWNRVPETASRTRGRIERVLDAAKAKGLRSGDNPARWRGHLSTLLSARKKLYRGHHPALPFADAPAFMVALRAREAMSARGLEWTILNAARTGETLGARRKEIDLVEVVWTVPGERMKMKVPHRVPLSGAAVAVLKAVGIDDMKPDDYLFPNLDGDGPLSDMAMEMLLRRMGVVRDVATVHGFRSTFRDWAGEATSFPTDVIEAALAHQVGTEVERAYRRGDALEKRRKVMEAWAGYLGRPAGGKVVLMRRG
ncbi:MAG: site-specific integrase [Caulobacter sp.]|nr:site-specific integrase [Caulobacter sp.]